MSVKPFSEIGNYTTFPNAIIDEIMPRCKPNTWKVVCATVRKTIGWHKDDDKISLTQYMELTGISGRSTISTALKDAVSQGYLVKKEGRINTYSINREYKLPSPKIVPEASPKIVPEASPKIVPTKESKTLKDRGKKIRVPDTLDTLDFHTSWTDFQEHRKQMKKPMTDLAKQRMLAKLEKQGVDTAIVMLENSIENGWQGVFEIKGKNGNGHKSAVHEELPPGFTPEEIAAL